MIQLKKLSKTDGRDVFEMLKGIKASENSFTNPTYDMSFSEYQEWLLLQEQWDRGENLPDGYVAQSIYWLYEDVIPIGIGKIRHSLTTSTRNNGGNIGYAISFPYRGKGYGTDFLRLLLEEAKFIGVEEIILTIDVDNEPSIRVCENNGGMLFRENNERRFYRF